MAMNKQIKLYSINLGMAKTEKEIELYKNKYDNEKVIYEIKKKLSEDIKNELNTKEWTEKCSSLFKERIEDNEDYNAHKDKSKEIHRIIKDEIIKSKSITRSITSDKFKETNKIAFFENNLTRTLGILDLIPTKDFMVIEVGNTDMLIVEQAITNGLYIDGSKYKFFTAGAGQTRQKKFMIIKESVWNSNEKFLMCGLTIDRINELGGMNINKFNAYLSLNNSASEVIHGFDIDRCIVVDDVTEEVSEEIDYITRDDEVDAGETSYTTKTGKVVTRKNKSTEWSITRTNEIKVPFDFMDGAGICLESIFKKNTQFRMPWFKGLLCPVNFVKYIKENNLNPIVKDIYGKEYDVIKDDIKVIFTKSQFKMAKYYNNILDSDGNVFITGWEVYKACFKYYHNVFSKCMEDEDKLKDMRINYQMLQTLTDMTDEEIEKLTKNTKELINKVHVNRDEQLKFLGATLSKKNRSNIQEILRLYPELLSSKYMKKQLEDSITSFKKEAKSGRIRLKAKRVFIIPDLVHFMSMLFGDGSDYALESYESYFNVYKDSERLAMLRSPHLSREWVINKNTSNDKTKYFKTNGIYISAKDLSSKVLAFDNDGDEALVVEDCEEQKWLLDLAEKQMKDLRPLYYEMGGGEASIINSENTYKSLKFVYEKSNIGKVSNTLTNIWSKDDVNSNEENIKKLCAYNNWIIDSAKKLELPKLPKKIKELMSNSTYPHFFQFAKKKDKKDCRPIGNGVIDRICKSIDNIENNKFDYSKGFGKFKKSPLLNNKKIEMNSEVIDFYKGIEIHTRNLIGGYAHKYGSEKECGFSYTELAYGEARKLTLEYSKLIGVSYSDMIDMIVKYSFEKDEMKLAFVFNVFGATIINNIKRNIKESLDNGYIMCECCGKRVENNKSNNKKYCDKCQKEIDREHIRVWKQKNKESKSF